MRGRKYVGCAGLPTIAIAFLTVVSSCSDRRDAAGPADSSPPGAITDLRMIAATESTVTLRWTAPADDGPEGRPARYEILLANAYSFEHAKPVEGVPTPAAPGTIEEFTIGSLDPATRSLYLWIHSFDAAGNASARMPPVFAYTALADDTHWWDGFAAPPD